MLKLYSDDTIAAIATAIGTGGIGIIRISGKDALNILKKVFKTNKKEIKSHLLNYGYIEYNGETIDEVLAVYMQKPRSYTKEDVVEINCHGGVYAVKKVLDAVLKSGARLAEPGEFTKRAFLNGRIDITQAEGVIDIINAKTELAHKSAMKRLEGGISKKIKSLRDDILKMAAHIEAAIDYPEHDDETMTYAQIKSGTMSAIKRINKLIINADLGKIINSGINTAIIGKPNAGKSSLLNYLLDEERAIVTDIPGTTRDALSESINIGGIALNITDTAGIRETDDEIEKIGVKKAFNYAENADLIILMLDGSKELDEQDIEILDFIKDKKAICVINKNDLEIKVDIKKIYSVIKESNIIFASVKNETGIEKLEEIIKEMFFDGDISITDDILLSSERNKVSLENALKHLENVIETIDLKMPEDFITMDLTESYRYLGEITGESLDEDIIDKIFSEFCLGK